MNVSARNLGVAVALGFTLAASPVVGQGNGEQQGRGRVLMGGAPLVEQVLRRQSELGLSTDQLSRLEVIASRLGAQNAPLVEQLRSAIAPSPAERDSLRSRIRERAEALPPAGRARLRERLDGMTPGERRGLLGRPGERFPEELAGVAEEIRVNNAAAMQEAVQILTPEQLARVSAAIRGMRAEGPAGGRAGRQGRL